MGARPHKPDRGAAGQRKGIRRASPTAASPPEADPAVEPAPPSSVVDWLIAIVLSLLTIALFFPNTANEFSSVDDNEYVSDSPMVLRGLTFEGVYWAFTSAHFFNWLPVTTLSHMLDVELYGTDPFGHHLTNILLHAVNAALVFAMLLTLTGRRWPSLVVALLFAVHPLRVESVAWLAERKDLLAGTFFLLIVIAYAAYVRRPAVWRYLLVLALLALGLMSKTMLVTVPFLLLLLDCWPLNRLRLKRLEPATAIQPHVPIGRLVLEKLPMLVLVVAAAAWTMILQRAGKATELTAELTFGQRTANAVVAVWRYVGKLVAPVELSPFYPHPGSWPNAVVMASVAGVVLVSVVVVLAARRRPYLLVGWCWFLGMLFPVSGVLVHAGRQSIADRYMYLPGLGLLIGVVWLFDSMIRGRVRCQITAAGVTGVLAVVYASLTARYQQSWQNDVTLYSHALQVDGKNWFAAQVLGRQLKAAGQPELAADYFRRSLAVSPGNQRLRLEFATLLLMMMPPQPEEAAREFRELARAAPNHPGSWVGLARAELAAGRPDAAEAAFIEADRRWPDLPDVQAQWSLALARMGRMEEARRRAAVALQGDPTNEVARLVLSGGATSRPASP